MPGVFVAFPWWSLLVDVLAAARLTRLLTRDTFPPVRNVRAALIARTNRSGWSALWVCAWCLGFWVALLVLAGHLLVAATTGLLGVAWWSLVLAPLAASYVIGFLADREGS